MDLGIVKLKFVEQYDSTCTCVASGYYIAFSCIFRLMGSVNKIFHQLSVDFGKFGRYVTINMTLSAPPKHDYMCVNSIQRKYREKLHRENTTANSRA